MTSDSIYYSLAAFLLCFAVITFLAILQLRNTMSNRSNWIQSLNDRVRYFRFCLNLLVLASSLLGLLTTAILLFYAMSDLRSSGSLFEQAFHVTLSLLLFASQYVVSCICQLHFWTLADKLGTNDETYNVVWKVANWFVGVVGLGGIAAGGTFCFSSDFDYALSVPVMRLSTCVGMLIFALLWLAMLLRLRALVHSATRELTRRSSNVDCGGEDEMMNSPPRSSRHRRSASTVQSMTMLTGRIRDLLLEGILFFLLAAVYCLLEFAATVYSPDILDGVPAGCCFAHSFVSSLVHSLLSAFVPFQAGRLIGVCGSSEQEMASLWCPLRSWCCWAHSTHSSSSSPCSTGSAFSVFSCVPFSSHFISLCCVVLCWLLQVSGDSHHVGSSEAQLDECDGLDALTCSQTLPLCRHLPNRDSGSSSRRRRREWAAAFRLLQLHGRVLCVPHQQQHASPHARAQGVCASDSAESAAS